MRFSPRVHPYLADVIRRMDVDRLSAAEVWRRAGDAAATDGLSRPGYHTVLALVREERRRRAERREVVAEAVDNLWAYTPDGYGDLVRRLTVTRRPPRPPRP